MLEVIAIRAEDAVDAHNYGAQRIELVSAIELGGLTPDAGLIEQMVQESHLPVMVMARPHARSFVYDVDDMAHIKAVIETCKQLGAHGIVFGSLDAAGDIDTQQLEQVIGWAEGLSLTFHRAFDEARDLRQAYDVLGRYAGKVSRVLSSGGAATALEGRAMLAELQRRHHGVDILVGAGVNAATLPALVTEIGAKEYHSGGGARLSGSFAQSLSQPAIMAMRRHLDELAANKGHS